MDPHRNSGKRESLAHLMFFVKEPVVLEGVGGALQTFCNFEIYYKVEDA